MRDYPKPIKQKLRQYVTEAYENELQREMTKLEHSFAEWHSGKISSGELSQRIHIYDTGRSRKLFDRYNHGDADINVAYAIVTGVLEKKKIAPEVLAAIANALQLYQSLKDKDELLYPD